MSFPHGGVRTVGFLFSLALFLASTAHCQTASEAYGDELSDGLVVSGPQTHKNLSVYFLHRKDRDDREFLTLNEGLKAGLVTVTEQKQEQVQRLMIDNRSDKPLFLQEGDRVTGGKQDRTIYSSLVIKAKSGPMAIPTFCVEQSRWQVGSLGKKFTNNANVALASNAVRKASKLSKSQGKVWDEVGKTKSQLQQAIGNRDSTSSLNEALDSKQAIESTKAYVQALGNAAEQHGDLVGVAFALNGELMEINVYPGCPLVKSVYPRLLETYALDAVVEESKKAAKGSTSVAAPSKESVLNTMKASAQKQVRSEDVNDYNQLTVHSLDSESAANEKYLYRCETQFEKGNIHTQWLFGQKEDATTPQLIQGRGQQNYNVVPQTNNRVEQRR